MQERAPKPRTNQKSAIINQKLMIALGLVSCALMCVTGAYADCLAGFSVSYDCGDGTSTAEEDESTGTPLPSTGATAYNASFTPSTITAAMCTPPTGKMWAGTQIGDSAGYTTTTSASGAAFTYMFTHDITITPRYIDAGDMQNSNFTQKYLYDRYKTAGRTYCNKSHNRVIYNGSEEYYTAKRSCSDTVWNAMQPGEWAVVFPYGEVTGYSVCSPIAPKNTTVGYYTGYIADDQTAIQNAWDTWSSSRPTSVAGRYCYCKLAGSAFSGSPWVFLYDLSSASACAFYCAVLCGNGVQYYAVLRGAVFSAGGANGTP